MEKKDFKWPSVFTDNKKTKLLIVGGVAAGILFMTVGTLFNTNIAQPNESDTYFTAVSYTESLENRIEELCTSLAGITEAKVLLTLENSTESVYAGNTTVQNSASVQGNTFDYIFMSRSGEEEPVLLTEIYPKIRGVAVVCTNGNDISVQVTITKLLSASLGISSNRIQVAGS